MRLKHHKISKGSCFYIIHPVYKNGRNTSQAYEQLGYPKGDHHCDSLKNGYGNTLEPSTGWSRLRIGESNSNNTDYVKIKKSGTHYIFNGFRDFLQNELSNMGKINITPQKLTHFF